MYVTIIYVDCTRRIGRDVVFVIDSRGYSRFQQVRELTEKITIYLKLSSPETLFGLITFDYRAQLEFNISKHTDLSTLLPAINPGLPHYRYVGHGPAIALNLLLSGSVEGGFLQLRNQTSKVAIIIITDYSWSISSLRSAANSLHAANIFDVYAIGTGRYRLKELLLIASDPSFVFSTKYLTSVTVQRLENDVTDQLCAGE